MRRSASPSRYPRRRRRPTSRSRRSAWGGKIFATLTEDLRHLPVFVGEDEPRALFAEDPSTYEELWWGKRLSGVRVDLAAAATERVTELLEDAWRRKAPKKLVAELDGRR